MALASAVLNAPKLNMRPHQGTWLCQARNRTGGLADPQVGVPENAPLMIPWAETDWDQVMMRIPPEKSSWHWTSESTQQWDVPSFPPETVVYLSLLTCPWRIWISLISFSFTSNPQQSLSAAEFWSLFLSSWRRGLALILKVGSTSSRTMVMLV